MRSSLAFISIGTCVVGLGIWKILEFLLHSSERWGQEGMRRHLHRKHS